MWKRFLNKYDHLIYRLSYKSLNRLCKSDGGFAYLFYLYLGDWLKENPISSDLKYSTESFFNSLKDCTHENTNQVSVDGPSV